METNHEPPRHEALEGLENKLGDGSELRHRVIAPLKMTSEIRRARRLRRRHPRDCAFSMLRKVPVLVHVQRLEV